MLSTVPQQHKNSTPPNHMSSIITTTGTAQNAGASSFSSLHSDVIETHILTRLDATALASTSSSSCNLRSLSSKDHLWSELCISTWPSTASPTVRQVISAFPGGAHSFFSRCFPIPGPTFSSVSGVNSPPELISAVDIHYRNNLIFSKVQETETVNGWFRCSPFRIDMLEPKEVVPTAIEHPDGDETCENLMGDMRLTWVMIDRVGKEVVNLSSQEPVSVQRHWLSGEVQVRFATILGADEKRSEASGLVQCGIMVTCGGSEGGEMQIREVSLEVENVDGVHLNGKDSLTILQGAMEGKRGRGKRREGEGRERYMQFLEMRRERRERELKRENTLDALCVALGVSILASFWFFLLWK